VPVTDAVSQLVFRGRKRNGAMDAIRFQSKRRLRAKLIGQRPLNQLSSLPGARSRRPLAMARARPLVSGVAWDGAWSVDDIVLSPFRRPKGGR
jgi:hypothetical protein